MNGYNLSEDIKADIETMKGLKMGIIPGADFYREVRAHTMAICGSLAMISWLSMALFLKGFGAVFGDLILVSCVMVIPGMIISSRVAMYVVFVRSIKPHIRLGSLIDETFKRFMGIFIGAFSITQVLFTLVFHAPNVPLIGARLFGTFFCLIVGAGITNWYITMEISRVGLSGLLEMVRVFADRPMSRI